MQKKLRYYWQCGICGAIYKIKRKEWRVIYGCRKCHKHKWEINNRELLKIEK